MTMTVYCFYSKGGRGQMGQEIPRQSAVRVEDNLGDLLERNLSLTYM